MKINEQKEIIENVLKESNIVTKEGELIEIHDDIINQISSKIIKTTAEKTVEENEVAKKGIQIRKDINEFEEMIKEYFGNFYFNFYNNIPKDLDDQFKFRFIFLCTYLKYGDDRLMIKQENGLYRFIKENELMELLKLSEREYMRTKKELINKKLIFIEKENKSIHINENISIMGNVQKGNDKNYTKVFKNSIRELYNESKPREHKKLSMLIKLMPYVHFQYNIICKNPTCEFMEDIRPLTIKEIMVKIFDEKNVTSFKKKILGIKCNNKKITMLFEDFDKTMIAINPSVFYRGTRKEALNYLISLFEI